MTTTLKLKYKTPHVRKEDTQRNWVVIDAQGKTLGRLATAVVKVLRGKHKPAYSAHVDNGDFVIILNADKIKVTGNKHADKTYYTHTLYPGGFHAESFRHFVERNPQKLITVAVKRMMPKTRLSHKLMTKLKVYKGDTHPHKAQKPVAYDISKK